MKSDVVLHRRTAAVLLEWFRRRQASRCCMWRCFCHACARDLKELCSNECEDHFFCWAAAELIPADDTAGLRSYCLVETCGGCGRHISTRCAPSDRKPSRNTMLDFAAEIVLDFAAEIVEESRLDETYNPGRLELARHTLAYLHNLAGKKGDGA